MGNKDPAFLFYSNDFLTGVADLTMQERGQYITLLCLQHQNGHLSDKTIRLSLGLESVTEINDVMQKFTLDENGKYYQHRLEKEIIKREEFAETRRINGSKGGRPKRQQEENKPSGFHMDSISKPSENLIENVNVVVNKDISNNDFSIIINQLEKCGFGINSHTAELVSELQEEFATIIICQAIAIASEQAKHSMSYVKGILKNYKSNGSFNKQEPDLPKKPRPKYGLILGGEEE